jgi:predicted AAA+ superfamily ATPase
MALLQRHLASALKASLADSPAVFLQGARQTGKSTLARSLLSGRSARYLTLDDAATLAAAESDPRGFVAGLDGPVVIDEVQRAPGLALAIKASIDERRDPGRFLLTGSANPLVLPRLADSLAGRIELHTLWPLSQGELGGRDERFIDRVFEPRFPIPRLEGEAWPALTRRLAQGGYPEMLTRQDAGRREAWFGSYLQTILQRDVRDIASIRNLSALPRLLALLASRAAGLLDYSDLARSLSLPQSTLKRYYALLVATFLVHELPAWYANLGKRVIKAPKLLLNDTGLLMYLLGADASRLTSDPTLGGSVLENFVAMELLKQRGWAKRRVRLFHFHSYAGEEVDVVLEDAAGQLVGIEVKTTASVTAAHFKGLRALADATGDRFVRGIVLAPVPAAVPFGEKLLAVPLATLWS